MTAHQLTQSSVSAVDILIANSNAIDQSASILASVASLVKAAVQQEQQHIVSRLQTRESREPIQDKDMTGFQTVLQDEKDKIDAEFEKQVAELERQYAV